MKNRSFFKKNLYLLSIGDDFYEINVPRREHDQVLISRIHLLVNCAAPRYTSSFNARNIALVQTQA